MLLLHPHTRNRQSRLPTTRPNFAILQRTASLDTPSMMSSATLCMRNAAQRHLTTLAIQDRPHFTKVVNVVQGMEAVEQNTLKKGDAHMPESVYRMGGSQGQRKGQQQSKPCYRCGATDHLTSACRFKAATCHNSQKTSHITKVCRSRGNQGKSHSQIGRRRGKTRTISRRQLHHNQRNISAHFIWMKQNLAKRFS